MRPIQSPLGVQYPCRCGSSHPRLVRLFSMDVLVCPEETDDALHYADTTGVWRKTKGGGEDMLEQAPTKVPYLVTGEGKGSNLVTAITTMNARMHDLEQAVARAQTAVEMMGERVREVEGLARKGRKE